jgi:hypothetical protein
VPHDQLAVNPRVLDKQTIGVIPARDDSCQVASCDRSRHGCLVVRRDPGHRVDWNAELAQHGGIRMVAGHSQHGIGRKQIGRSIIGEDLNVRGRNRPHP